MRRPRPGEETTARATSTSGELGGPRAAASGLCLHVILEKSVTTYPLPVSGEVVIGRATDADVRIADAAISRRHAMLRMGPPLQLEDLGGSNGVTVGGTRLAPGATVPIEPGAVIGLGTVMAVVQRAGSGARPRRVWSHGHFEGRVEDECARSQRLGAPFAVLRVDVSDRRAEEILSGVLRAGDVLATYGPGELEALLIDVTPPDAERLASDATRALREAGMDARAAVVCFPRDARTAEEVLTRANDANRPLARQPHSASPILGNAMRAVQTVVERIARGNINVVLAGETGVGKELVAELVHALSPRSQRPLHKLNCASLSEALLASELFGHERGAFTGADRAKAGILEAADGGTVFLDEVGELPASVQPKLLRVLEDKIVTRVGAIKGRPVDVRFVAATNRDLEAEVAAGRFRQDLYFRLSGFQLRVPSLRERPEDIAILAGAFVEQAARSAGLPHPPGLSREALDVLQAYSWPGNVRELRNMMDRAVLLCTGGAIGVEHLATDKMHQRVALFTPASPAGAPGAPDPLVAALADREKQSVVDALARCAGNQTHAARLLGISRGTLLARMTAYGLARPRKAQ